MKRGEWKLLKGNLDTFPQFVLSLVRLWGLLWLLKRCFQKYKRCFLFVWDCVSSKRNTPYAGLGPEVSRHCYISVVCHSGLMPWGLSCIKCLRNQSFSETEICPAPVTWQRLCYLKSPLCRVLPLWVYLWYSESSWPHSRASLTLLPPAGLIKRCILRLFPIAATALAFSSHPALQLWSRTVFFIAKTLL